MKKVYKLIITLLIALILAGCNDDTTTKKTKQTTASEFGVKLVSEYPTMKPYKDYDIMDFIVKEQDTEYEFEGVYLDQRMKVKEIVFDGTHFTVPENGTGAEITVTATKGSEVDIKEFIISVTGVADPLDAGIGECWHEDSMVVTENYNPQYVKDGDSSLYFKFSGYFKADGVQFACITGHMSRNDSKGIFDTDYLSIYEEEDVAKAYEDAVLCFLVYNDMKDQSESGFNDKLTFAIRIKESSHSGTLDMDYYHSPKIQASRGEWTLVAFYLKDIGKTTDFYKDIVTFYTGGVSDSVYRDSYDQIALKALGFNLPYAEGTTSYDTEYKYNFAFYFDSYDIMSKAQFEAKYSEYLD